MALGLLCRRAVKVPLLQVVQRRDRGIAGLKQCKLQVSILTSEQNGRNPGAQSGRRESIKKSWKKTAYGCLGPKTASAVDPDLSKERRKKGIAGYQRKSSVERRRDRIKAIYVFCQNLVPLGEVHVLGEKAGVRGVRVCRHGAVGTAGEEGRRKRSGEREKRKKTGKILPCFLIDIAWCLPFG
jgi:hypothetical protein